MSQQPAARINACSIAVKSLCRSEHRGSAIEATSVHQKCDAFLLHEAYVADSKVEQQAFICVKGVVW